MRGSGPGDEVSGEAPNSPEAISARGEFLFYLGDMSGRRNCFALAFKLNEENARAQYGLYRLFPRRVSL